MSDARILFYAGLGLEATRTLASAGARVVVPARDLEKAGHALAGIEQVEIEAMDLIDPEVACRRKDL